VVLVTIGTEMLVGIGMSVKYLYCFRHSTKWV
jgi:hypothetical protein